MVPERRHCGRCGDFIVSACLPCATLSIDENSIGKTMGAFIALIMSLQALTFIMNLQLAGHLFDYSALQAQFFLWLGPFARMLTHGRTFKQVAPEVFICGLFIVPGLIGPMIHHRWNISFFFTTLGVLLWLGSGFDALTRLW